MRYDWRQLSPREKDALLRHFILHEHTTNTPVTPEEIYEAMQRTHFLSCTPAGEKGKGSVFQFLPGSTGKKKGAAVAEDTVDGIYKAALRSSGVDLFDANEQRPRARG